MRKLRIRPSADTILAAVIAPAQIGEDACPSPFSRPAVLRDIVNEASGEMALQNEILLAGVNRNRKAEEYIKGYFETDFLLGKLKEYGADEAEVIDLPTDEPDDLGRGGSRAVDVVARPAEDRRSQGRRRVPVLGERDDGHDRPISFMSGPVTRKRTTEGRTSGARSSLSTAIRVPPRGSPSAATGPWASWPGRRATRSSTGTRSAGDPSGTPAKGKPSFGFMVSERTGQELRDMLERGTKIVSAGQWSRRALVPYKETDGHGPSQGPGPSRTRRSSSRPISTKASPSRGPTTISAAARRSSRPCG